VRTLQLQWFLLLSITIHTLVLWRLSIMPPYKPAPFYPYKVRLLDTAPRSSAQIGMWGSGRTSEPDVKQK